MVGTSPSEGKFRERFSFERESAFYRHLSNISNTARARHRPFPFDSVTRGGNRGCQTSNVKCWSRLAYDTSIASTYYLAATTLLLCDNLESLFYAFAFLFLRRDVIATQKSRIVTMCSPTSSFLCLASRLSFLIRFKIVSEEQYFVATHTIIDKYTYMYIIYVYLSMYTYILRINNRQRVHLWSYVQLIT